MKHVNRFTLISGSRLKCVQELKGVLHVMVSYSDMNIVYCFVRIVNLKSCVTGDSGGPLCLKDKLYGCVSGGFGCGHKGLPVIYTNVASFKDWINAHL